MTPVVAHLERQVRSSQTLLGIVLAQGEAIKAQDAEGVLARLGDVQTELLNRQRLEEERDALLGSAAAELGIAADDVRLEAILDRLSGPDAERARALSGELRGLLLEVGRVHEQNRVLLRQELAFLDHLMRALSGAPRGGYSPAGWSAPVQPANALDARA